MTKVEELSALAEELASITEKTKSIERKLDRLSKWKPTGGVRLEYREMKWNKRVFSLLSRVNDLQERGLSIQKRIAVILEEEGTTTWSGVSGGTNKAVWILNRVSGGGDPK